MKNIYFKIFLIFALPLLFLAMGADTGGMSGSGSCVSSNTSSSDIGEGAEVEFIMSLSQDNCCRAVIKGSVPDIEDIPYEQGELRVIADGGDFENPLVKITVTGITSGMQIRETIPGLMPGTLYKAKFFALNENDNTFVAYSNETPLDTTLKTITTQSFGHSMGYFVDKMESADGKYWNFIASFSMDSTEPDQAGILVVDKTIPPQEQQDIFTIDGISDNPFFDYNLIADVSVDRAFTFVCDPDWGKMGSYPRAGKCYIFINESDVFTESFSVENADMQVFNPTFVEQERVGGSHSYDPATKAFLVGANGVECHAPYVGNDCGLIAQFTLDADNKAATFVKFVQEGKRAEARLGQHIMGDFTGSGKAGIAFLADIDRFGNNTRCALLKVCQDSFDCEGTVLAQFSAPWCSAENQGQGLFWQSANWHDYNGDGYDDVAFIVSNFFPDIKALLSIWWGGPSGLDPENVFQFGADITGDGGWTPDTGDINGDGADDLVILGITKAYVYLNQDTDSEPVTIDLPEGLSGAVADIDGDGYADFVRVNTINGILNYLELLDNTYEFVYFVVSR